MRGLAVFVGASALLLAGTSQARDLDFPDENMGQEAFRAISEDLGALLSYKPLQPAEPLGVVGFDVGVEWTSTFVENSEEWAQATGSDIDTFPMARLSAQKGLPFGIDIGATYASAPDSDVEILGGQLRYALMKGGITRPALGIRAGHTRVVGHDDIDFETTSVDLSISKGFGPLTPYGGVGQVWITSDYTGDEALLQDNLEEEDFSESKVFAGVRMNFVLFKLTGEVDQTGDATSVSAKLSIGF